MSWYRDGTISVASGSKAVTGTNTTFNDTAAGVNPGDMIIVGGQFLEVASVNSATSITTVNAATAAVTNASYQIVTTLQMSNASLAKKVAAAMDRILLGVSNWMLIFKGSGTITITNYDGSTATGLAWPSLTDIAQRSMAVNDTQLTTVNAIMDSNIYTVNAGATGLPSGVSTGGLLENVKYGTTGISQKFKTASATSGQLNREFLRYGVIASGAVTWTTWAEQYTTITKPSLNDLSGTLAVANGGTGGTTQATARSGLGLGTAATANVQTSATDKTSGSLISVGGFGLGAALVAPLDYAGLVNVAPGLYQVNGSNWNSASGNFGGMVSFGDSSNGAQLFIQNNGGNFMYRGQSNKSVYIVRSTQNTTVDGSGFIKQASPIARLSNDPSEMPSDFYNEFAEAGVAAVNEEAEGVRARRSGLGSYIITGCVGLAAEGWQIEVPKDINGNRLCFVKSEMTDAGNLSIKVFKPKLDLDTGGIVAGDAIDIPAGRWIDLRLEMPADSAYNLRMSA